MENRVMKVKITNANPDYWYADHLHEEFTVCESTMPFHRDEYEVVEPEEYIGYGILKTDCELTPPTS